MTAPYIKGRECLHCNNSNEWIWKWYGKGLGYYRCKKCDATMPNNKKSEKEKLYTWEDYEKE